MSGRSATIILRAKNSRLPLLELFVGAFSGASDSERMKAKIVASELFDNLVAHARGVWPPLVMVRLRAGPPLTLTLGYRSSNLSEFVSALDAVRTLPTGGAGPRYDASSGLYRGFGLAMCVRLTSSIQVRRGLLRHLVSVVF